MNLENKTKVDFTDAHLWIESGVFAVTVMLGNLHEFFPALGLFEATITNHLIFEGGINHDEIWVEVQFRPKLMAPLTTSREVMRLLKIAAEQNTKICFIYDQWGVVLDDEGGILDRWELENRV